MVRHEAAEALGGIASDGVDSGEEAFDAEGKEVVDVLAILREWAGKSDAPIVVRESCQVAIDMWEVGLSTVFYFFFFILPSTLTSLLRSLLPTLPTAIRFIPHLDFVFGLFLVIGECCP